MVCLSEKWETGKQSCKLCVPSPSYYPNGKLNRKCGSQEDIYGEGWQVDLGPNMKRQRQTGHADHYNLQISGRRCM